MGTEAVAKAAADGTTLLIMANSFIISPIRRSSLSYNPLTSFEPICLLGTSPQILAVNGSSPFYKLAGFVTAARAEPGELSVGANGPATTQRKPRLKMAKSLREGRYLTRSGAVPGKTRRYTGLLAPARRWPA